MRRTEAILAFVFSGLLLMTGQEVACSQESVADSATRTWTARDGGHTTKATLIKCEGGVVQLRKQDGTIVSLAVEKLSDADQEFIKNGGETSELLVKCQQLSEEIARHYKGKNTGGKAKIAVVEFSDLSGDPTDFGRLLSEELITKLSNAGSYTVVERFLLNKAIEEHKLQLQGLVDPKSAKELGKILGVDAIISGTIADLGTSLRVNARVISTETGEVLSGAAVTIVKDDTISGLMATGGKPTGSRHGGSSSNPQVKGQPITLPFREDFSQYEDGDGTPWGPGGKVRTGSDGRKWLMPVGSWQKTIAPNVHVRTKPGGKRPPVVLAGGGQTPVGLDVELPQNAYIEFDYDAKALETGNNSGGPRVLSGISLIDEAGAKYRIEWVIKRWLDWQTSSEQVMTLPGGSELKLVNTEWTGTVTIHKRGDKITVIRDDSGQKRELSGNVSDFKKFTRVEVDLYKGQNAVIAFTNFRIGKLQ